jgi:hypothetical protein
MEKLYSRVFCISERKFVAESITIAKNQELKNSELGWSLGASLSQLCPTVPPSIQDGCCY